jgi:hypothetical protein
MVMILFIHVLVLPAYYLRYKARCEQCLCPKFSTDAATSGTDERTMHASVYDCRALRDIKGSATATKYLHRPNKTSCSLPFQAEDTDSQLMG